MGGIAVFATACSTAKDSAELAKSDPNRPAVIQAPPIILPSDTAKPDTMPAYRAKMEAASSELLAEYSVMAAASVIGDRRTLGSALAPDAVVRLADTTFTGRDAIISGLMDFALRSSLRETLRQSRALNAIGTTYTDSGTYIMISRRGIAKPVEQRGTYVATWKLLEGSNIKWQLVRDELTPDPAPTKR
jgi:hypothetical protein